MKMKGTNESPTLSIAVTSISTLQSLGICFSLCLQRPVRSVHFGIEALQWHIAVKATLRGINEILSVG